MPEIRKWTYRKNVRFSVPAEVVGPELDRIRNEHDGILKPDDVVASATPEDSPLHSLFEWDDTKAANEYRKQEARQVISSVQIITISDPDSAPRSMIAFVHTEGCEQGYRATVEVLQDEAMMRTVLGDALAQLNGLRLRYKELAVLSEVWNAVDRVTAEHQQSAARKTKKRKLQTA